MPRDESLFLADIDEACKKILKYTAGMTYKDFHRDDLHFDAVVRNLEVIGEAVKHISSETQQKSPQTKWRKIADFRNVIAHAYFGVSAEIIWDIVENEIPPLLKQVKGLRK
jgi:uncharacterized protein with HEPN domain